MRISLSILSVLLSMLVGKAQPPSLEDFTTKLTPLSDIRTIQADFTMHRHIQALDFKLEFKGILAQERNHALRWEVMSPLHSISLFTPQQFRQWDEQTGKTIAIKVNDMPWVAMVFNAQTKWLEGDLNGLKADFNIVPQDDHTLQLEPKTPQIQVLFKSITLTFAQDYSAIKTILFVEPHGDTITVAFSNVRNNQDIEEKQWKLPTD